MATRAGVGQIDRLAPAGQLDNGPRQRVDRLGDVLVEAPPAQTGDPRTAGQPQRRGQGGVVDHDGGIGVAGGQPQQRIGSAAAAAPWVRCRPGVSSPVSFAVSRGPLLPCAARLTRTRQDGAGGEALGAFAVGQKALGVGQSDKCAGHAPGPTATTRPRYRSPTPSGAPGRHSE